MRRSDKEVTQLANILAILDKCEIMRIGLCVDNKPYIVPLNFAYEAVDEKLSIYFHSAPEGKKLDMMAKNNFVCFEADCSYKTIKTELACNWAAEFESVIGEGKITILADEAEKIHALDLLMKRYGLEGKAYYSPHGLSRVTVLQVSVTSITGKIGKR